MQNEPLRTWIIFLTLALGALGLLFFFSRHTILNQPGNLPTPTPLVATSGNIVIYSPTPNERVSQTFQVKGKVRVFENTFSLRVKNKITGKVYLAASTQANAKDAGVFTEFTYNAQLTPDATLRPGDTLLLEVFQFSAKDGTEIDKVTIPLQFTPLIEGEKSIF